MELDDLKNAWRAQPPPPGGLTLNAAFADGRDAALLRAALRRFSRTPWVELVSNVLVTVWLGSFLEHHLTSPRLALPGGVLFAFAALSVGVSARLVYGVRRLDYGAPVVEIQRQLGRIRSLRLRSTQGILVLSPLLWTPLAVVVAWALFRVDLYRVAGGLWIPLNLAFGFSVLGLAFLVAKKVGASSAPSRLKWLEDALLGGSLKSAAAFMEEVVAFEGTRQSVGRTGQGQ